MVFSAARRGLAGQWPTSPARRAAADVASSACFGPRLIPAPRRDSTPLLDDSSITPAGCSQTRGDPAPPPSARAPMRTLPICCVIVWLLPACQGSVVEGVQASSTGTIAGTGAAGGAPTSGAGGSMSGAGGSTSTGNSSAGAGGAPACTFSTSGAVALADVTPDSVSGFVLGPNMFECGARAGERGRARDLPGRGGRADRRVAPRALRRLVRLGALRRAGLRPLRDRRRAVAGRRLRRRHHRGAPGRRCGPAHRRHVLVRDPDRGRRFDQHRVADRQLLARDAGRRRHGIRRGRPMHQQRQQRRRGARAAPAAAARAVRRTSARSR